MLATPSQRFDAGLEGILQDAFLKLQLMWNKYQGNPLSSVMLFSCLSSLYKTASVVCHLSTKLHRSQRSTLKIEVFTCLCNSSHYILSQKKIMKQQTFKSSRINLTVRDTRTMTFL